MCGIDLLVGVDGLLCLNVIEWIFVDVGEVGGVLIIICLIGD